MSDAPAVQQPTSVQTDDETFLLQSLLHYVNSTDIVTTSSQTAATSTDQPRTMSQRDSQFLQGIAKDIFWGFDEEGTNTDGIDWAAIWQILRQNPGLELTEKPSLEYTNQTAISS